MLAFVLGQAVDFDVLAGADACAADCEDEAQGKDCPPVCPTCACTLRAAPSLAPHLAALRPPGSPTALLLVVEADAMPPSPDLGDALHVPIVLLG